MHQTIVTVAPNIDHAELRLLRLSHSLCAYSGWPARQGIAAQNEVVERAHDEARDAGPGCPFRGHRVLVSRGHRAALYHRSYGDSEPHDARQLQHFRAGKGAEQPQAWPSTGTG